jgi:hypothetical protein
MNNYITLDSLKYKTSAASWTVLTGAPRSARITLSGALDSAYNSSNAKQFNGQIIAPVTAEGAGWGTVINFRATAAKTQNLTLTDHHSVSYTIIMRVVEELSLSPMWDGVENEWHMDVEILAVTT